MRDLLAEKAAFRCGDSVQVYLYADDLGLGCANCDLIKECNPGR